MGPFEHYIVGCGGSNMLSQELGIISMCGKKIWGTLRVSNFSFLVGELEERGIFALE